MPKSVLEERLLLTVLVIDDRLSTMTFNSSCWSNLLAHMSEGKQTANVVEAQKQRLRKRELMQERKKPDKSLRS